MNVLVLLAVLGTGQVAATNDKWLDDYGAALKQAKEQRKPLLIVIDRPNDAVGRISQISHSESPSGSDLKNYVLCRVDADSKYGQAVAKAFETTALPFTAVIDNAGQYVLFEKSGQFSSAEWTTTLTTYHAGVRPASYASQVYEQSVGGGSYCPNCQRGR